MEYLTLILKRAFGPTLAVLGALSTVAALAADAIWGDNKPVQFLAWGTIAIIVVFIFIRLLLAPYKIWKDDQKKLEQIQDAGGDPLSTRKKWLSDAASGMLSSAKSIYNEWSVSDKRKQDFLRRDYSDKRERVSKLADSLLASDEIYRAAQDAMNRCDILMADSLEGTAKRGAFQEVHEYTKNLLTLLSSGRPT